MEDRKIIFSNSKISHKLWAIMHITANNLHMNYNKSIILKDKKPMDNNNHNRKIW